MSNDPVGPSKPGAYEGTSITLSNLQGNTRRAFVDAADAVRKADLLHKVFKAKYPGAYAELAHEAAMSGEPVTLDGIKGRVALDVAVTGALGFGTFQLANAAGQNLQRVSSGEIATETQLPVFPDIDLRPDSAANTNPLETGLLVAGMFFASAIQTGKWAGNARMSSDALRAEKAADKALKATVRATSRLSVDPATSELSEGQRAAVSTDLLYDAGTARPLGGKDGSVHL